MNVQLVTVDRRRALLLLAVLLLAALGTIARTQLAYDESAPFVPPAPLIVSSPASGISEASFRFSGESPFECSLDSVRFVGCSSPVSFGRVPIGRHVFMVRAIGRSETRSDVTVFHWTVATGWGTGAAAAPNPVAAGTGFAPAEHSLRVVISGDLSDPLSPGRGGPLLLRIGNPHPFPIEFTRLRVIPLPGSTHAGCDGQVDLGVRQSNLAGANAAVRVPAGRTVTLPERGATAPFLWMRDLPTNQDACKGAQFRLRYEGLARRASSP